MSFLILPNLFMFLIREAVEGVLAPDMGPGGRRVHQSSQKPLRG